MSDKEKKLIHDLLKLAADNFSDHGCNDLPDEIWDGWTDEERRNLISEYHMSNGDPEAAVEGHIHIEDWVLMHHMAEKIIE